MILEGGKGMSDDVPRRQRQRACSGAMAEELHAVSLSPVVMREKRKMSCTLAVVRSMVRGGEPCLS